MAEPEIVAFIEARLAEDEQLAREADAEPFPDTEFQRGTHIAYGLQSTGLGLQYQAFALMWDPARVLAEIAAKRRVLARHHPASSPDHAYRERIPIYMCTGCGYETSYGHTDAVTPDINDCPELRDLAAIWNEHPDYRHAWGTDG